MEGTRVPVPDDTTPRGMLIPEIDDVDPVLTPAEQTQLDDRRRLLDTASIGYQRKWDDGTIMEQELSNLATIIDASKRGRNVNLGGVPVTPGYREALESTFREFQEQTSMTGMPAPAREVERARRRSFNRQARDAIQRARDPAADIAWRNPQAEPEPGPQDVDSLLAEFRREDGTERAPSPPRPLEEGTPPPNQTGEGVDRHLEGVLSTMNAMSDRSRRLYPAEMSAAVQNMRGAPLAATYVQARDAVDSDYMAEVEHALLRNRQLKRRRRGKSRHQ